MVEVEQTSSGPTGLGTTLKGVYKVMEARMPWTSYLKLNNRNQPLK
jgi:hypothetical protein